MSVPGVGAVLSTLIAVGFPLYLLGVLALERQLEIGGGLAPSLAWHGAFLVAKPTAVLQAAKIVTAGSSIVLAAVNLVGYALVVLVGQWLIHVDQRLGHGPDPRRRRAAWLGIALLAPWVLVGLLVTVGTPTPGEPWQASVLGMLATAGGVYVGVLRARWAPLWAALLFCLATLILTFYAYPVRNDLLLHVTVPRPGTRAPALQGELVAHTDGYWYVLTPLARARSVPTRLVPVPDGDAKSILLAPADLPTPVQPARPRRRATAPTTSRSPLMARRMMCLRHRALLPAPRTSRSTSACAASTPPAPATAATR